ncbi:MAG: hypothetical protein H6822_13890 [Planctomycetaceae bacterium]|nr:hypothetical protein [Planctomycetales bacterium]MCB9923269.1 hypothetical protein [Planctomycetaceae bacterium]
MTRRFALLLVVLAPSVALAADAEPDPILRWLISTHKTLAELARDNPLSYGEKMWDKLSECGPDRPLEMRAKLSSMRWSDGILSIVIGDPLGWYKRRDAKLPQINFTRTYHLRVSKEKAVKLRTGTFVIIVAEMTLFTDYNEYQRHRDTDSALLTLSTGIAKMAYYASDNIELKIDGVEYPDIYDSNMIFREGTTTATEKGIKSVMTDGATSKIVDATT